MQEQLSQELSRSLSEAVSEFRSSIQTLNNPQKVFILSQQFIIDTIGKTSSLGRYFKL